MLSPWLQHHLRKLLLQLVNPCFSLTHPSACPLACAPHCLTFPAYQGWYHGALWSTLYPLSMPVSCELSVTLAGWQL